MAPAKHPPSALRRSDSGASDAAPSAAAAAAPSSKKRSNSDRERTIQEHTGLYLGVEPIKRRRSSAVLADPPQEPTKQPADATPVAPEAAEAAATDPAKRIDGAPEGELFVVNVLSREQLQPSSDVTQEAQELAALLAAKDEPAAVAAASDAEVAWGHEFAAVDSLRRFAVHHKDEARRQLGDGVLTRLVLPAASSLRSAMSRNALLCLQDLILDLKTETASHFEAIVPVLLSRACSEKQFIRDLAREVLDTALAAHADEALLEPLLGVSTSEKNAQVVSVAGSYVSKCVLRMDRAHFRTFVLETRSSFLDEMAAFLRCRVVECKAATRRSCQHTRRVLGDEAFVTLAKQKLSGSAQLDVLKASEIRKAVKPGHAKPSIRERMLQLKKQQRQRPNDVAVVVLAPPPPPTTAAPEQPPSSL